VQHRRFDFQVAARDADAPGVELTGAPDRHHIQAVRGTAENPMTRAEVDAKSYDLMAPVSGKARARALCDAVWNIEKLKDVRALRPLLRA